jgi:hypothetical protein
MKAVGWVKKCWSHNKSIPSSPLSHFWRCFPLIREEPKFMLLKDAPVSNLQLLNPTQVQHQEYL